MAIVPPGRKWISEKPIRAWFSAGKFVIFADGSRGPIPPGYESYTERFTIFRDGVYYHYFPINSFRTGGHLVYAPATNRLFNTRTGEAHLFSWWDGAYFLRRHALLGNFERIAPATSRQRARWKFVYVQPVGVVATDTGEAPGAIVDAVADHTFVEWPPRAYGGYFRT